jgi:hypothetical protein
MRGIRKASDQRDLGRLAFILDRTKILLSAFGAGMSADMAETEFRMRSPIIPGKVLGKGAIFEQNRE